MPFQTLIGTVKSRMRAERGRPGFPWRFQTLIGTVKRRAPGKPRVRTLRFQTLIGTVKR